MNAPVQASQIARPRLGDQLVAQGLISPDQLRIALQEQKNTNQPLGAALLALGFITEDAMRGALAEKLGEQEISLKGVVADFQGVVKKTHAVSSQSGEQRTFDRQCRS